MVLKRCSYRWSQRMLAGSNENHLYGRQKLVLDAAAAARSAAPVFCGCRHTASKSTPPSPPVPSLVGPKSFLIGSLAGMMGSLAGMGGGFVMIPLMTSNLLRLTQHEAHGTSLFAVAATGIAGAFGYAEVVQLEAATAIAVCGMVTARFGAATTSRLSAAKLKRALGVFMLCVAPLVPAKAYFKQLAEERKRQREKEDVGTDTSSAKNAESHVHRLQRLMIPMGIGLGSGFLAGLFGVGGGAIVVPALSLGTDMTHYQALGTSLCAMAPPAIVGTYTHYSKGNVSLRVAPALAVGSFVGAYLGGRYIGMHTDETTLRWGFSGLMTFLGLKTLIGG